MNAFSMLPYAIIELGLGIWLMLRLTRWLDTPSRAAHQRRQAHRWHNAVVDAERAQGIYVYDGSITDIKAVTICDWT